MMSMVVRGLLFLSLSWVMQGPSSATAQGFDCYGSVSGVCRSPSTCTREFDALCPESAACCPERGEEVRADPVSGCNNRKCFRNFGGWWSATCASPARTMFFCETGNVACCSSACRIQPECVDMGGSCINNKRKCDGTVYGSLCKGYSCFCCVPANATTASPTTVDPNETTPTIGDGISTTPKVTTAPDDTITTPMPTCIGTSASNLPMCPATGEEGVECTCVSDCSSLGSDFSGMIEICPISNCPPVKVKCMDGWTIFVYRNKMLTTPCNFTRTWNGYKAGFGSAPGEYWLGLEYLHALTATTPHSMVMYGKHQNGSTRSLVYEHFTVGSEEDKYQLSVSDFSSTLSIGVDLFVEPPSTNIILNGSFFSTFDQDNDNLDSGSCSENQRGGGWWFNDCTGIKATQPNIDWYFWNYPVYEQGRLQEFFIKIKRNI